MAKQVFENGIKKENTNHILAAAINHYGTDNQRIKVVEELSELIQAIAKVHSCSGNPIDKELWTVLCNNLFEEIADVEIMLEQLKMMYNCFDEVSEWKDKKIARLQKRLEGQE